MKESNKPRTISQRMADGMYSRLGHREDQPSVNVCFRCSKAASSGPRIHAGTFVSEISGVVPGQTWLWADNEETVAATSTHSVQACCDENEMEAKVFDDAACALLTKLPSKLRNQVMSPSCYCTFCSCFSHALPLISFHMVRGFTQPL